MFTNLGISGLTLRNLLISSVILIFSALPVMAERETIARLTDDYEALVRYEDELLQQKMQTQRRIDDKNLILIGKPGGPIWAIPRSKLAEIIDRQILNADLMGVSDAYISTLPWYLREIAKQAIEGGLARDQILKKLGQNRQQHIDIERENLISLNKMLEGVRERAKSVLARREELRAMMEAGEPLPGGIFDPKPPVDIRRIWGEGLEGVYPDSPEPQPAPQDLPPVANDLTPGAPYDVICDNGLPWEADVATYGNHRYGKPVLRDNYLCFINDYEYMAPGMRIHGDECDYSAPFHCTQDGNWAYEHTKDDAGHPGIFIPELDTTYIWVRDDYDDTTRN